MTPTISTPRLILRPLLKASMRQLEWLADDEVTRYSETRHREHTMASQLTYIRSFKWTPGSSIWGIYLVGTGEHIGNLTATHDEPNNVSDIGIMIGEVFHWKKGFATEAWTHACDWLLSPEGGVRKLEAGVMKSNEGMLCVLHKSGFKFEGERPSHFLVGGGEVAAVHFGRHR